MINIVRPGGRHSRAAMYERQILSLAFPISEKCFIFVISQAPRIVHESPFPSLRNKVQSGIRVVLFHLG